MVESVVTSEGRTTVPKEVRNALRARPGTRLEGHVTLEGDVIVRAKTQSIFDLEGSVQTDKHVNIADMNPSK